MPEVIVCQNSKNYHVISFDTTINIGRDSTNGIALLSPQVSRQHAQIQKEGNVYLLVDLGSTNAIWLGNEKIQSLELIHGTTFRIADFFLTFVNDVSPNTQQLVLEKDGVAMPEPTENKTVLAADVKKGSLTAQTENFLLIKAAKEFIQKVQLLKNPNEDEILHEALATLCLLTNSHGGFITLLDTNNDLVYRATVNFDPDSDNNCVNHQIVKQVINTGITELSETNTCRGKTGTYVLCSPLSTNNKTMGCGYFLTSDSPYQTRDRLLCELLLLFTTSLLSPEENTVSTARPSKDSSELKARKDIIIKSDSMLSLYKDVQTIAPINVPALILGEAGTGKELVAAELHTASQRKGEFITLNCSAIPEGIFESELFGSKKGAFQDAQDKPGKLELAHNGTLFLDEIGDMSLQLQPKLLRFLENQEVTRLGDNRVKKLNVRVVAATNQNLSAMIKEKSFRADLFQRLSCFTLKIPPLEEREADIEPLIIFFLEQFSQEYGWSLPPIHPKAMKMLRQYSWPGNVRELRNASLRLAVHSQGKPITPDDILRQFEGIEPPTKKKVAGFPTLEQLEEEHIYAALHEVSWNISDASKLLGIARSTFYKKMQKYEISQPK